MRAVEAPAARGWSGCGTVCLPQARWFFSIVMRGWPSGQGGVSGATAVTLDMVARLNPFEKLQQIFP
jgi:hypothetical protein